MRASPISLEPSRLLRREFVEDLSRHDPVLTRFAVLMILLMVPTLMAMSVDVRTYNGVNVWLKPFKFELSLAAFALTLTFFAAYVDERFRAGRTYRIWVAVIPFLTIFNLGYIIFRAARAEPSHFNRASELAEALYAAMGIVAVVQISLAIVLGVFILRSHERALAPALRLSIGLGLIAGAVLTIVVGGYTGAQAGHWVGGIQDDVHGVPFFGWSRTGGDLRVSHFIGMHAMQGLPLIGLLGMRFEGQRGRLVVWFGLLIWIALTLATLFQAIAGRPLFPL